MIDAQKVLQPGATIRLATGRPVTMTAVKAMAMPTTSRRTLSFVAAVVLK